MTSDPEIRRVLESAELMRLLATAEHERWAHWQKYVHDQGERQVDGSLVIPSDLVARWDAQIATTYSSLTAKEQRSDQDQVQRYLPIILNALTDEGAGNSDDPS